MEDKKENSFKEDDQKHDADSGNDSTNEMLQKEKLIDPGNEHNHNGDGDNKDVWDSGDRSKHDADAGGDGTGSMGSKPE